MASRVVEECAVTAVQILDLIAVGLVQDARVITRHAVIINDDVAPGTADSRFAGFECENTALRIAADDRKNGHNNPPVR